MTETPFPEIPELLGPIQESNNLFVRPASGLGRRKITPIWYKYSLKMKGWLWTPYADQKHWMDVKTTVVTGNGRWCGQQPAQENIKIIKYLREKNPIPPHITTNIQNSLKNHNMSKLNIIENYPTQIGHT